MEFNFEKGSDMTILLDGEPLGGVYKLKKTSTVSYTGIYEFLTDKPVAKVFSYGYILELYMRCEGACPFEYEQEFELELIFKNRRDRYSFCTVKELEYIAEYRGAAEYRVQMISTHREDEAIE